jgi:hypothetical protein
MSVTLANDRTFAKRALRVTRPRAVANQPFSAHGVASSKANVTLVPWELGCHTLESHVKTSKLREFNEKTLRRLRFALIDAQAINQDRGREERPPTPRSVV